MRSKSLDPSHHRGIWAGSPWRLPEALEHLFLHGPRAGLHLREARAHAASHGPCQLRSVCLHGRSLLQRSNIITRFCHVYPCKALYAKAPALAALACAAIDFSQRSSYKFSRLSKGRAMNGKKTLKTIVVLLR